MTLANFVLAPKQLVAFSDSMAYLPDGRECGHTSKIAILNHLHAVLIVRGLVRFCADVERSLRGPEAPPSAFDNVMLRLPERARRAWAACVQAEPDIAHGADVYVGGWSAAEGRMRLLHFASTANFAPAELEPGVHLAPKVSSKVKLPASLTLAEAIALADAQREMMRLQSSRAGGAVGIGGRLYAAELLADRIVCRMVHHWEQNGEAIRA